MSPSLVIGPGSLTLAAFMLTFWGIHLTPSSSGIPDAGLPILALWHAAQWAPGPEGGRRTVLVPVWGVRSGHT